MAPELLTHQVYGRRLDIWSLGCTIIEMATGTHPWKDCKGLPELILLVMNEKCPPIPSFLSSLC